MEPVIINNILESMPIGLIVLNVKGEIVASNAAATDTLGYTRREIMSKAWAELFFDRGENEDFNQIIVDVIINHQKNLHRTVSYVNPTGDRLQLSITSSFLRERHATVGVVVLIDDITELHRLHENEKRAFEYKERLQRERVASLNHFAMSIAHQVRNPIMSMGGFANRLLKNIDNPQRHMTSYLEPILHGISRLEAILKAVEDYCSTVKRDRTPASLDYIIDQVRSDLDARAAALNKRINWSIRISVQGISLNYPSFFQSLREVIVNSLESFDGEECDIEIVAKKEDHFLILEIKDSGSGIKEEDLPFIFDPFFSTKTRNIGMGLCKAKRIIEEENGNIQMETKLGLGTKATITLSL